MPRSHRVVLVTCLLGAGCGLLAGGSEGDAGSTGAGGGAGAAMDAGALDAGLADAGPPDAGAPDAGPRRKHLLVLGSFCSEEALSAEITGPGTIGPWKAQAAYPSSFGVGGLASTPGCVFSVGGYLCSAMAAAAEGYSAAVSASGAIASWEPLPALPLAQFTNRTLVVADGLVNVGAYTTDRIHRARLKPGSCQLEAWSTEGTAPAQRIYPGVALIGSWLYYVGGGLPTFSPVREVFSAEVSAGFNGLRWAPLTPLPAPGRFGHELVTDGTHLFSVGGADDTGPTRDILVAPLQASGMLGSWSQTTPLPEARWFLGAQVVDGYLYVTGGGGPGLAQGSTTVWSAPIDGGVVGPFKSLAALPAQKQDHRMVVY